jgi:hypothetical protein
MALSVFNGEAKAPTPEALRNALRRSAARWDRLVAEVATAAGPVTEQWHCAGAKYGWSVRPRQKDRVLLYLIAQSGSFLAGIVLGEKAVVAARAHKLPEAVLAAIDAAPRYAEGRGRRLPVKTAADVRAIATLVSLKLKPGSDGRRAAARDDNQSVRNARARRQASR